jgi:L-rhamnose-H+ transport protein
MSTLHIIGIAWVLLGGTLNGTFFLPMKRMPRWRWENTWLAYSVIAMVVMPWTLAIATIPHLGDVYQQSSWGALIKVTVFGLGWGVGSVFFGLGVARVGMALGYAIVLGITASLGSLFPLIILHPDHLLARQGYALMAGTALVILGLAFLAIAGRRREKETLAPALQSAKSGFGFGMVICVLSGIFSAMLNFSFVFGKELTDRSLSGAGAAMAANSVWALALSAGFLANAGYCVYLLNKNHTWPAFSQGKSLAYVVGVVLMGLFWFGAIVFYGVGAASLGTLGGIVGWPLLMTMTVITANFWGAVTGEWTSASRISRYYWWSGIATLLLAIYVISLGGAG